MLNTQIQNEPEALSTPQQQPWEAMSEPDVPSGSPQEPVLPPPPEKPKRGGGAFRRGSFVVLTLVLLVIFGVGLFAGWQFSRTSTTAGSSSTTSTTTTVQATSTVETTQEAAIAKVKAAVVEVNVTTQSGSSIGSGVIIDQRGYIVTNNHVISGAQSIEVALSDGTHLPAQLVGTDPADDLAVLKITTSKHLTVATLGDSSKLQVGQDVLAIGNPLGVTQSVSHGIISALGRTVSEGQGGATINNAIQTDAALNPGDSGGALIDLQGNLIGIPTLGLIDPEFNTPATGVGFAIPSNTVASIVHQLIENGHV
jgi:S1-C subfamily serine protease